MGESEARTLPRHHATRAKPGMAEGQVNVEGKSPLNKMAGRWSLRSEEASMVVRDAFEHLRATLQIDFLVACDSLEPPSIDTSDLRSTWTACPRPRTLRELRTRIPALAISGLIGALLAMEAPWNSSASPEL